MKRLFSILGFAGGVLLLASCSQEELQPNVPDNNKENIPIEFRVGIANQPESPDTRVDKDYSYVNGKIGTINVIAFIGSHMIQEGETKEPEPYFHDMFMQQGSNTFQSTGNYSWPGEGSLEFFGYAPSLDAIRKAAYTQLNSSDEAAYARDKANYDSHISFFNMCTPGPNGELDPVSGSTTFDGVPLTAGYKLGRFYVATDISKQVDFITVHTSADTPEDGENVGVPLHFHHQL